MNQKRHLTVWGIIFLVLFSGYFSFLSQKLPSGSGPDELAHYRAAQFVYENRRLAIFPKDESLLHYAPYGTTRSFRPPFTYIVAAGVHHLADKLGISFKYPFRIGNAITGGVTALILLLTIFCYSQSIRVAVCFTALAMLMPQVSFIFSYLNSDGAAVMAVCLVLLSAIIILKNSISCKTLGFFGVTCGILSLCKMSAWVFSLPICLFVIFLVLKTSHRLLKSILIVLVCFALIGGWRIASNIYNHGIENPFNWALDAQITQQHARIKAEDVINYKVLGHSYLDLLANENNFLVSSFFSFVGNLDWLRLRVGTLQYSFYGVFIAIGLLISLFVLIKAFFFKKKNSTVCYFQFSIIAGIILQFFLYLRFNIYHDLQHQGKYVLPAFPGLIMLLVMAWMTIYSGLFKSEFRSNVKKIFFGFCLFSIVYVHAQGLYKYVIPFYFSDAYVNTSVNRFTPIQLIQDTKHLTNDLNLIPNSANLLSYEVTGHDPYILFQSVNIKLDSGLILLRLCFLNSKANNYSVYWDEGVGITENTMVKGYAAKGQNIIYQILPVTALNHLRFDLGTPHSQFTLIDIAYSKLEYKTYSRFLNKIFNVKPSDDTLH